MGAGRGVPAGCFAVLLAFAVLACVLPARALAYDKGEIQVQMINIIYCEPGGRVTCDFHGYSGSNYHEGIDFALRSGAEICSMIDGEVVRVTNASGSNLSTCAIYDYNRDMTVVYLHGEYGVSAGQRVSQGEVIGTEAGHGNVTGPHTHIEVRGGRVNGAAKSSDTIPDNDDPYPYWDEVLNNHDPVGNLDVLEAGVGKVRVRGWAYDPDNTGASIDVHVYVGSEGHAIRADQARDDVNKAFGITGAHGFDTWIDVGVEGTQDVSVFGINVGEGGNALVGNGKVTIESASPKGSLDSVVGGRGTVTVKGWAYDPSSPGESIYVHVYVGAAGQASSAFIGSALANLSRSDVNETMHVDGDHGFEVTLPTDKTGSQDVHVYAINIGNGTTNPDIGNKTATIQARPSAKRIDDGSYIIRSAVGNVQLDIAGGGKVSGTNAQIYHPNGADAQIFSISWDSSLTANKVSPACSGGLQLDKQGGEGAGNVIQYADNGGKGQRWVFEDAGDGWYYIRNVYGYYLDVDHGNADDRTNVIAHVFNGDTNQKWKPVRVSGKTRVKKDAIALGGYTVRSAIGSRMLDVSNASTSEGAKVQIWQQNGNASQFFRLGYNDSIGSHTLRLVGTAYDNRWLDAGKTDGPHAVSQYAGNGGSSQNWFLEDAGSGWYYIRNLYGYYLDVKDAKDANGAVVQAMTFNGSSAQKWKLERPDLSWAKIDAIPGQTYTGKELKPAVGVKFGNTSLSEGTNYTVSYKNNVNVGTATVTISGVSGNCTGTKSASFNIAAADMSAATIAAIPQQTYSGTAAKPKPTVTFNGRTLAEGTDYTVSYANNVNAGTATVTITGKGALAGTKSASFTIRKAKQTVSVSDVELEVGETAQLDAKAEGALSYSCSDTSVAEVSSTGLVTAKVAGTVTITVNAAATANYEAGSAKATVTVTGVPRTDISGATVSLPLTDVVHYTGSAVEPSPTVTLPGQPKALVRDVDYTLSYRDNVEVGNATMVVTGIGTYTGTATGTFRIRRDPRLSVADVELSVGESVGLDVENVGDGALSYEMSGDGTSVATADGSGVITAKSVGTATVVVRSSLTDTYAGAVATATITVREADGPDLSKDGWVDLPSGGKGYARGGALVTGWMDLGTSKFYFQPDGSMSLGWTDVVADGKAYHYYFNPASGNLVRNTWFQIDGKTYYFRPSGNLATGWATISDNGVDKKYYLDEDGQLVTGWRDIDNGQGQVNHYYFRPSGAMATGWATIDGQKYWFRPSGNMATGFTTVDDAYKRYFDESGHMLTGWQQIGGKTYYFRTPSGAMQTGTVTIDGSQYVFSDKGVLVG